MNGKAVWTVPAVTFGLDAALLVTFLASAVVRPLLAKLPLLPAPLAVRAADNAAGLDFLRNSVVVAAAAAVAVSSPLGDTEVSTAKREKEEFVIGLGYTHRSPDHEAM